jgi:ABC-2 type transport system permease protein
MKNLLTIAYYELKRILRNPRLVVIVLSQPIVIPILVGLIFYQDPQNIKIGLVNEHKNVYSDKIEERLKTNDKFEVSDYSQIDENEIKSGRIRGFVKIDIEEDKEIKGNIKIFNDPAGKVTGLAIESEIAKIVADLSKEIVQKNINQKLDNNLREIEKILPSYISKNQVDINIDNISIEPIKYEISDVTPFKLKFFDFYASAIMVLLIILVVLNLSGMSITSERVSGTFERLFVTPYSKLQVLLGKALAQLVIGILIAFLGIISLYLIYSISIGNVFLVILINLLVGITAITLGLLISSITYTVFESVELAMYAFFISVLTTGIISPAETAYKYFPFIMKINPFYYAVDASRRVNMLDASWSQIANDIYIIVAFLVGFFILSVLLLKREAR